MTRFGNVRPPAPGKTQPPAPEAAPKRKRTSDSGGPAAPLPPPPPALRPPPQRGTFSVRVQRELADGFGEVIKGFKRQGWALSSGLVIEHFFEKMQDPDFAQAFMLEIAGKRSLEQAGED